MTVFQSLHHPFYHLGRMCPCLRLDKWPYPVRERASGHLTDASLIKSTKAEGIYWRQRSKVQCLAEGDNNTTFFHKSAGFRKKYNWISRTDYNGSDVSDRKGTQKVFREYFRGIFDVQSSSQFDLDWSLIYPQCNDDLNYLDGPFSLEEIKEAVFSFKEDCCMGSDGITMCFFATFLGNGSRRSPPLFLST